MFRAPRQLFRSVVAYTAAQLTTFLGRASEIQAFNQGGMILEVDNATRAFRGLYLKGSPGNSADTFLPITTGIVELPATPEEVLRDNAHANEVVVIANDGRGGSLTRNAFVTAFTLVGVTDVQTLTNKTLTSPTVNGGNVNNASLLNPRANEYLGSAGPNGLTVEGTADYEVGFRMVVGNNGGDVATLRVYGGGVTDNSLRIEPEGNGGILLTRPVVPTGTVANINGGAGQFASPIAGQTALATNATGGPKPAWYDGAAWRTADGAVLV